MEPNHLFFPALVCFAPLIPFSIHLLISRLFGFYHEKSLRQKGAIISAAWGYLPLALLFVLGSNLDLEQSSGSIFWSGVYIFTVYSLFAYVYFHLFNMSETARRVRILAGSPASESLTKSEIARDYTCGEMITIRLKRLLSLKEIRFEEGRYLIDRGTLVLPARAVSFFHDLLFPKK